MLNKIKNNLLFIFIILILISIIYKQYSVIKNNNILSDKKEKYTNYVIKNYSEINNDQINNINEEKNNINEEKKIYEEKINKMTEIYDKKKIELEELKEFKKKFKKSDEFPIFKNDILTYKNLSTSYSIIFPDYDNLNTEEIKLLEEIFNKKEEPTSIIDKEYFPYNHETGKVDMNFVIPTMTDKYK